jgi:hypothetical protein
MRCSVRASRALLEAAAVSAKSLEERIADLVRHFGTDSEGEAIATWRALGRLLAANNVNFTDLGDAILKLADGGLERAAMERILEAGRREGAETTRRKHAETLAAVGLNPDGSVDAAGIVAHLQRNAHLLRDKDRTVVEDMTQRLRVWGGLHRGSAGYLFSIFYRTDTRIQ